jgi:hypothetical protein
MTLPGGEMRRMRFGSIVCFHDDDPRRRSLSKVNCRNNYSQTLNIEPSWRSNWQKIVFACFNLHTSVYHNKSVGDVYLRRIFNNICNSCLPERRVFAITIDDSELDFDKRYTVFSRGMKNESFSVNKN